MRTVQLNRNLAAPRSNVWAVLADYPDIASWNSGVKKSYATSDATSGVGAKRHCDLAPAGGLEETIAEWVPEERLVISIDSADKLPIKRGRATFSLGESGESTPFEMNYEYEPKGGPLAFLIGPLLDRQLNKGFIGFINDLELAAQDR